MPDSGPTPEGQWSVWISVSVSVSVVYMSWVISQQISLTSSYPLFCLSIHHSYVVFSCTAQTYVKCLHHSNVAQSMSFFNWILSCFNTGPSLKTKGCGFLGIPSRLQVPILAGSNLVIRISQQLVHVRLNFLKHINRKTTNKYKQTNNNDKHSKHCNRH